MRVLVLYVLPCSYGIGSDLRSRGPMDDSIISPHGALLRRADRATIRDEDTDTGSVDLGFESLILADMGEEEMHPLELFAKDIDFSKIKDEPKPAREAPRKIEVAQKRIILKQSQSQLLTNNDPNTNGVSLIETTFLPFWMNPIGMIRKAAQVILACACFAMCCACIRRGGNCGCNCRRLGLCKKFLLWAGYDEFKDCKVHVTVHSMRDTEASQSLFAKGKWRVQVSFWNTKFQTALIEGTKWEQSKVLTVEQGAAECKIQLLQQSMGRSDIVIGEKILDTNKDILCKEDQLGIKQCITLDKKGKDVGSIWITFRLPKSDEIDGSDVPIFQGLEEDSALSIHLIQLVEEEQYPKDMFPLEGLQKQKLLGKVLHGNLKDLKGSKHYIVVQYCSKLKLLGKEKKEKAAAKMKSAGKGSSKGDGELGMNWYWCQWKTKESYEEGRTPGTYFPIVGISKIESDGKDTSMFSFKDEDDDRKYWQIVGKERSIWVDGLRHIAESIKETVKQDKSSIRLQEKVKEEMPAGWDAHNEYMNNGGTWPKSDEEFKKWESFLFGKGIDHKVIVAMHQQIDVANEWDKMESEFETSKTKKDKDNDWNAWNDSNWAEGNNWDEWANDNSRKNNGAAPSKSGSYKGRGGKPRK